MGLTQARADWNRFSQAGFGVNMTFTPPVGLSVSVKGLASKHHLSIDADTGQPVNSKNSHVSVKEELLTDEGYPVRGSNGEVSMVDHLVSWKDSTGTEITYKIAQTFPSETVGVIVMILSDYE